MTRYGDYTMAPNFKIPVASTPPTQPAMPPTNPALPKIERATVVTVQPGDVLVFEVPNDVDDREIDYLQRRIRETVGDDTLSIVVNGRFGGVIRRDAAQPASTSPGVLVRSCRNCRWDIFQPTPGAPWQHRAIGHCSRAEPQP